jgi:hypothetical protein
VTIPKVLNKRHQTESGVYIGRPSMFGNPFVVGVHGNREQVIEKYRAWLMTQPDLVHIAKTELRGKNLVCWCAPAACHGDVLLHIVNEEVQDDV